MRLPMGYWWLIMIGYHSNPWHTGHHKDPQGTWVPIIPVLFCTSSQNKIMDQYKIILPEFLRHGLCLNRLNGSTEQSPQNNGRAYAPSQPSDWCSPHLHRRFQIFLQITISPWKNRPERQLPWSSHQSEPQDFFVHGPIFITGSPNGLRSWQPDYCCPNVIKQ